MLKKRKRFMTLLLAVMVGIGTPITASAEEGGEFTNLGIVPAGQPILLNAGSGEFTSGGSSSNDRELTEEEQEMASNYQKFSDVQSMVNLICRTPVEGTRKELRTGNIVVTTETVKTPTGNIWDILNRLGAVSGNPSNGVYQNGLWQLQPSSDFMSMGTVPVTEENAIQQDAWMSLLWPNGYPGGMPVLPTPVPWEFPEDVDIWSLLNGWGITDYIRIPTATVIGDYGFIDVPYIYEKVELLRKVIALSSISDQMELVHVREIKGTNVGVSQRVYSHPSQNLFQYKVLLPDGRDPYNTGAVPESSYRFLSYTPGTYTAYCYQKKTYYIADTMTYETMDYLMDAKTGVVIWQWQDSITKEVNKQAKTTDWVNTKTYRFTLTQNQISQWQGQPYAGSKTERRK